MRLFGLIGYPLTHSFSKKFFTEKFEREKLPDCQYDNYQLSDITELVQVLEQHPSLEGLNVTIPYKETVLPFLTTASEVVKTIGACNCIKIIDKKLFGFNTDVTGFKETFVTRLSPQHTHALILGTGGAAKAVAYVLAQLAMPYRYVSRNKTVNGLTYGMLDDDLLKKYTVIINTTPLGMYPATDTCPQLPYDLLNESHYLYDLVYNPSKTLFLQKGEAMGAAIQNGADMLRIQAEESWKIWNSPLTL